MVHLVLASVAEKDLANMIDSLAEWEFLTGCFKVKLMIKNSREILQKKYNVQGQCSRSQLGQWYHETN